jgi:glycosyltransferase involved in cell wall biosynthesis
MFAACLKPDPKFTMIETSEDRLPATLDGAGRARETASAVAAATPSVNGPLHPEVGILSIAMERYSPKWLSRQQVLTRLARYYQVLWMNPASEWRDAIRGGHLGARATHVEGLPDSFTVYDPPGWLPVVYKPSWLGSSLARRRLHAAANALRARGCRRIVLYIWHISLADALDLVPHDVSCYHIYDEYSDAEVETPVDPAEERLIRSVDQVITVSPTMFERKGRFNSNTLQVTNGVTYDAFAQPGPVPEDMATIPRPILGYSGFIKKQLDWRLLLELATRHPEWSFVFVGEKRPHADIRELLDRMAALPNVHFLGGKPSTELARYPQHFDVCLMPYRVNDYSKYIFPLKLYEYLAGGRPTVSVPLPALAGFGDLVPIAGSVEEWERTIAQLLAPGGDGAAQRSRRRAVARRHDWNVIVDEIARSLARRLDLAEPRP